MRLLQLTTPRMHGKDVSTLQHALQKSKYGNFKPGRVDGVYGENTAGAVRRAKKWLGYSTRDFSGPGGLKAGDPLLDYLQGKKKLPPLYAARRKRRLKAAQKVPLRVRMFNEAKKQVGVKESPAGTNKVLFSDWYGVRGPWCAMFVSWCGMRCSSKTFKRGVRYAYTPFMVQDARLGVNGMSLVSRQDAKHGHIVMFDWEAGGTSGSVYNTDHTGFFDKNIAGDKFMTVEGNTAKGNDSNGGQVMVRERSWKDVIAVIQCE